MGCGHAADRFAVGLLVRDRLRGGFEGAGSYVAQIGQAASWVNCLSAERGTRYRSALPLQRRP